VAVIYYKGSCLMDRSKSEIEVGVLDVIKCVEYVSDTITEF
jgi:hypothetical protein